MAKKSFKKGVDNLIQPTGNNERKEKYKTAAKSRSETSLELDDKFTLDLGSKLTIDKVPKFKQLIEEAIGTSKTIVLKSENVEDIDLTFIQMVMSAEKTCEENKKKLELELNIPDDVAQLLINSGFNNLLK